MPVKIKYGKRGRPTNNKRLLARTLALLLVHMNNKTKQQQGSNKNDQSIN